MPINTADVLRKTFVARMEYYPTLGSTNDRAAQCAGEDVDGLPLLADGLPLLIVADDQTAGRGRNANRWWTGHGSLAMSLLAQRELVEADRQRSPLVALAVAVGVVDAVAPLLPNRQVGIHWPNDVVVHDSTTNDRKLAGILVEVLPSRRYVIGIGLNTNNTLDDAPAELRGRICTIRDMTGNVLEQTEVLIGLLHRLERAFAELRANPAGIAGRADAICIQRNRMVTAEQGGKTITGKCKGIGSDGALLIDTPTGVQSLVSGTVRHRRDAG